MPPSSRWSLGRRARTWLLCWLAWLTIGTGLRVALLVAHQDGVLRAAWPRTIALGLWVDALVALVLFSPLAVGLALRGDGAPKRPWMGHALLVLVYAAAAFGAAVEYQFFEEFDARFNHVALDYLLYPDEVAGNIWESYPVPVYLLAALAAGATLAAAIRRGLAGVPRLPISGTRRGVALSFALGAPLAALGALCLLPAPSAGQRERDEIAANGLVQLVRAFRSARLDYELYYRCVPEAEVDALAAGEPGAARDADGQREFRALERREQPLDVVVVIGESFGSEFVGRLGGRKPNAPGFERWAEQGLLLTNLYATGNRTVRGLEGVLCSFVPLPGDSIWKRPDARGVATLADVLQRVGYRTEFVYGGDGAFDRMRDFALANGWQRFHDDAFLGGSAFPDDAFRTIWGVADEHIFDALLERQRAAARDGARFFGTALTVSNHKPYLTPDSARPSLRRDKLARVGLGLLLISACGWVGWRPLRRRHGRARVAAAYALVLCSAGALGWLELQPRDTREHAVRYADHALAAYLDRAGAEGLLEHTVVLFVGDHGARVYGAEEIPAASYRIPALFVAPGARYRGRTLDRLCSQVDLAPTLLSIAGVDARAPFFGVDLLQVPADAPGRAWMIHNRDLGLLTDAALTVLGLRGSVTTYRRPDARADSFEATPVGATELAAADRAAAVFQLASRLLAAGRYRLTHVE
jgi:phosphoglycerol transferase MdoB-like AlkP superfamily enzyme